MSREYAITWIKALKNTNFGPISGLSQQISLNMAIADINRMLILEKLIEDYKAAVLEPNDFITSVLALQDGEAKNELNKAYLEGYDKGKSEKA